MKAGSVAEISANPLTERMMLPPSTTATIICPSEEQATPLYL